MSRERSPDVRRRSVTPEAGAVGAGKPTPAIACKRARPIQSPRVNSRTTGCRALSADPAIHDFVGVAVWRVRAVGVYHRQHHVSRVMAVV